MPSPMKPGQLETLLEQMLDADDRCSSLHCEGVLTPFGQTDVAELGSHETDATGPPVQDTHPAISLSAAAAGDPNAAVNTKFTAALPTTVPLVVIPAHESGTFDEHTVGNDHSVGAHATEPAAECPDDLQCVTGIPVKDAQTVDAHAKEPAAQSSDDLHRAAATPCQDDRPVDVHATKLAAECSDDSHRAAVTPGQDDRTEEVHALQLAAECSDDLHRAAILAAQDDRTSSETRAAHAIRLAEEHAAEAEKCHLAEKLQHGYDLAAQENVLRKTESWSGWSAWSWGSASWWDNDNNQASDQLKNVLRRPHTADLQDSLPMSAAAPESTSAPAPAPSGITDPDAKRQAKNAYMRFSRSLNSLGLELRVC